jgi:hypothetical protein
LVDLGHIFKQNCKILACLVVCFFFVGSVAVFEVKGVDDVYSKEFKWSYGGYDWSFNMSIPKSNYDAYKAVPVVYRVGNGAEDYGFLTTTEDVYLIALAHKFNQSATQEGYSTYETVSFILAFIQSLPYTPDSTSTGYDEYPRFPLETLVDDGGDCEDTSILFATTMSILGYGVIYINPPGHLAVGILGAETLHGTYWIYNEKRYYYCETTGDGFRIGDLPSGMPEDQTAYLCPIDLTLQYIPRQPRVNPTQTPTQTSTLNSPTPTRSPSPVPIPTYTPNIIPTPTNSPAVTQNSESSGSSEFETRFIILVVVFVVIVVMLLFVLVARRSKKTLPRS